MQAMELPQPSTEAGRAGLAAVVAQPASAVIAVDFDGTLAPIVLHPEDARPAPGAVVALTALAGQVAAAAIVTGRPALDVIAISGLTVVPGLRVFGHYGLEEWHDGELSAPEPVPAVTEARRRLPTLLADAPAGVHVEDKALSLVVHTRPTADPAATLAALRPGLEQLAAELGLETVPGRQVLELRPPGVDKGVAVRRLLAGSGASAIVYLGDDVGDLAAFAVVEESRDAGHAGVTVASVDSRLDDSPAELADRADLVLPGPAAVVEFLTALSAAIKV